MKRHHLNHYYTLKKFLYCDAFQVFDQVRNIRNIERTRQTPCKTKITKEHLKGREEVNECQQPIMCAVRAGKTLGQLFTCRILVMRLVKSNAPAGGKHPDNYNTSVPPFFHYHVSWPSPFSF